MMISKIKSKYSVQGIVSLDFSFLVKLLLLAAIEIPKKRFRFFSNIRGVIRIHIPQSYSSPRSQDYTVINTLGLDHNCHAKKFTGAKKYAHESTLPDVFIILKFILPAVQLYV